MKQYIISIEIVYLPRQITILHRSDDGKTFIVKRPTDFEQRIIPQFFKHSKFSSFVRQLNFYGFRKIKFTESIRIDTQLEKQTANFWRFRHEKFVKGRPDLLVEIKRSNSTTGNTKSKKGTAAAAGKNTNAAPQVPAEEVTVLKSEMEVLKARIAKMTDNIGELTTLVNNVSLQDKTRSSQETVDDTAAVGSKRKKVQTSIPAGASVTTNAPLPSADMNMVVDEVSSSSAAAIPVPVASSALDDITFTPDILFPPEPVSSSSQTKPTTDPEEQAFVDELFNSFGEDMAMEEIVPDLTLSTVSATSSPALSPVKHEDDAFLNLQHPNAPDQKLMSNLSDALAVLPKDMQELLVNRLIATITSSDSLKSHLDSVTKEKSDKSTIQPMPKAELEKKQFVTPEQNPEIALPLAAATLTALMTQFSSAMKDKACVKPKSLPVIPIHA